MEGKRSAFEGFDPASTNMATERFETLAEMRRQSPVVFVPSIGMWAVTGYEAVREVLGEPELYLSAGTYVPPHLPAEAQAVYSPESPLWRFSMVSSDGQQHKRLRSAMANAFTMRKVKDLEDAILKDAQELVGDFVSNDAVNADLFTAFLRPLPSRTIARFFGLPVSEAPRFSAWSDAFLVPQVPGLPLEAYIKAATEFAQFDAYIREILNTSPAALDEGIVRALLVGRKDGTHDLSDDEIVGDIANVIFAGHETTVSTLSNIFVRLLKNRDLWTALSSETANIPELTEELLRLDTAGIGLFRVVSADCTLAGVDLDAGSRLWVSFGAANRDPAAFEKPNDIADARTRVNFTFGHGAHACIGAALARTQVKIAITLVPRAFPKMQLNGPVQEVPNYIIRATPRVPVSLS